MNVNKRLLWLTIIMLFGLAACRADQVAEEPGPDTEPTKTNGQTPGEANAVTLSFAVNGWERGRYDAILEQFKGDHPNIKVEIISIEEIVGNQGIYGPEGDPTEGLLKMVQGADVFNTWFDPVMMREGYFLDLAPLLDSDQNMSRSDFFPGVIDLYSQNGKIMALPFRSGYGIVFYNKDLFDAAGLPYPEPGWTWDDLRAYAQTLTVRSGGEVSQWGVYLQNFGHVAMLMSQGVNPFIQNGPLYEPNFNDPAVKAGIEDYLGWFIDDGVAPIEKYDEETGQLLVSGVPNEMGVYGMIEAGQVAVWFEYSDSWQYRKDQGNLNLGVAPYPISKTSAFTTPALPYGNVFMVSAGTTKSEAAWTLISYLTEHIDQMSAPYEQNALPARRSVAENSGFWDKVDPELAETLKYAAEHAFASTPYSPTFGSLEGAIQQVMWGDQSLDEALIQAQTDAEETIKQQEKDLIGENPVPDFTVLEPVPVADGVTTISFVVGGGDPALFREVAKRFNEENENIVVKIREPNYFQQETFSLATAVQDADCFQWYGVLTAPEDRALLLSPEPLLDADPELGREDFFLATLNNLTYEGQLLGLPFEVQVTLMNYNKRLFDDAGRPYPQPGWTMDDFLETAVAMTQGEDEATKIWGFVANPYEFGDMLTFTERFGADLINTDFSPPKVAFNSPDTISAVRWFTNLTTEYGVKPVFEISQGPLAHDGGGDPWMERQALIENDRAAIWTGDMFGMVNYSSEGEELPQDNSYIGYIPYPQGEKGGVGFDNVTGLYLMAGSPNRQACWEWVKYLTADPTVVSYGVPARISAAESSIYAEKFTPERAKVLIDSIKNSTRGSDQYAFTNENGWVGLTYTWLEQAYQKILKGDATVEQGLVEAQNKADDFIACMSTVENVTDYQFVDECAKTADPNWGQPLP